MSTSDAEKRLLDNPDLLGRIREQIDSGERLPRPMPLDGFRASNVELDDLTNGYSGGDLAPLDDDYYNSDSMHDTNEELRGER